MFQNQEIQTPQVQLPKRITISISNVAPLIGMDNYNNFPRIICEIWRRYNPQEFRDSELKLKDKGIKNLANASELNDIWEHDDKYGTNILGQIKDINANKDKSSIDMTQLQKQAIEEVKKIKTLSQDEIDTMSKKICSITNKTHGINNEDNIITEFCKLSEKQIQNTQGWVEIPLVSRINDCNVVVVGKYDAITTESELVEAKMRQKGLFKRMRDYENVQVQLYLHALGFQTGYLIEGFSNKKQSNMQTFLHEITYDSDYVNEIILERLNKFVKFLDMFLQSGNGNGEDIQLKEKILCNDPVREIWKIYCDEYLEIPNIEF
jgi:hypothetical protein